MKSLLCIVALITAVNLHARAELTDVTNGTTIHPAVTFQTNALSDPDLQDVLGISAYRCNVHRTSTTNGLAIYVEISVEGKPAKVVASQNLDRAMLDNYHVGLDIPVFFAINPVGSFDGEGIYSAKKLRCFLKGAGVRSSGLADNPFYKSDRSLIWWDNPTHESATIYKFMESNGGKNSPTPKIQLQIRFHEF